MNQYKVEPVNRLVDGNPFLPYEHSEEAALIQNAKKDPVAFEALYRKFVNRIYHYLRLRSNNDEDAADLTQQVFIKAFFALPKYEERNIPFAAWLFQIARNIAIDNHRHQHSTITWELLPQSLQPINKQNPEDLVLNKEKNLLLKKQIAKLDLKKREMLTLRFIFDLSIAEVALIVGKNEAAVRKQLARTLDTLKNGYEEQYNEK